MRLVFRAKLRASSAIHSDEMIEITILIGFSATRADMYPARTPPSPTKPKSGFSLHNLLTGVTPCPPATHAERWGKGPLSPPKQPIKVSQMVERYEAASLSASRDYSSIPAAPPSPSKIYNPSFKALPLSQSTSPPASPTKVPASFFQQSRSPLMNGLPAPPTPGKENSRPPIILRSSMRGSPPPSPTRSNRQKLSKDSEETEISDTGATDGGGSTVSAIPPFRSKAEVAYSSFKSCDPVPLRQKMVIMEEQRPEVLELPKLVERSEPSPSRPLKEVVRVSSFTEALPPSLPSLESSFFNPMDWESEVEKAQNVTVGQDYSTVEYYTSVPTPSERVDLATSDFETRVTESKRIAKIEAEFARLLVGYTELSHDMCSYLFGLFRRIPCSSPLVLSEQKCSPSLCLSKWRCFVPPLRHLLRHKAPLIRGENHSVTFLVSPQRHRLRQVPRATSRRCQVSYEKPNRQPLYPYKTQSQPRLAIPTTIVAGVGALHVRDPNR